MALRTTAFERIGVHLTPDELERLIEDAIDRVVPTSQPNAAGGELSLAEIDALERGSLRPRPPAETVWRALATSAAEYAALVATSYSAAAAAELLRVDPSRIRHRLAAHTLYGLKTADGWRLPRFQFGANGPLPGLERVLPRLDKELHPLSVTRWMLSPEPDLEIDGRPSSPRDWLLSGGDPAVVAEIASILGQGG